MIFISRDIRHWQCKLEIPSPLQRNKERKDMLCIESQCVIYRHVSVWESFHLWRIAVRWSCSSCPCRGRSSRAARPSATRRLPKAPARHRRAQCRSGCRLRNCNNELRVPSQSTSKQKFVINLPAFSLGASALLRLLVNCPRRDSRRSSGCGSRWWWLPRPLSRPAYSLLRLEIRRGVFFPVFFPHGFSADFLSRAAFRGLRFLFAINCSV